MCGIFGVVRTGQSNLSNDNLRRTVDYLFKLSESRGKESSGLAFASGDRIRVYKRGVPASALIKETGYKKLFADVQSTSSNRSMPSCVGTDGTTCIIGHARLVTNGSLEVHENNQPVLNDGLVGVHNGIIVNDKELWDTQPVLRRRYEVDTEVLLALTSMFLRDKSIEEATRKVYSMVKGAASVAILSRNLPYLLLATNTGSIYVCESSASGLLVFASERYILSKVASKEWVKPLLENSVIHKLQAGNGLVIGLHDLAVRQFVLSGTPVNESSELASDKCELVIEDVSPLRREVAHPKPSTIPSLISRMPPPDFTREIAAASASLKRCTRCLLPETMPFISFDDDGVCNFCKNYRRNEVLGKKELEQIVAPYRSKDGKPDCIVPFSGGRDSSFGLHYLKNVLKLNPIAYSYDWGMITDLARRNQARMCGQLGIEHILVSADIKKKRENIRLNIEAWFKNPELGMIPIFMAGDKQFFYYANKLMKQTGIQLVMYLFNPFEKTDFKSGFCGVRPRFSEKSVYYLSLLGKARIASYYAMQYARNPAYFNGSLADVLGSFFSYYVMKHKYVSLYNYIKWDENEINKTLITDYDWETAADTNNTWRIGDGTAPFYNLLYYVMAGFTENDTFRSNQIREGLLTREKALALVTDENRPRLDSFKWYCDTVGLDYGETLAKISRLPRFYRS